MSDIKMERQFESVLAELREFRSKVPSEQLRRRESPTGFKVFLYVIRQKHKLRKAVALIANKGIKERCFRTGV
jgi:hypothetical protein